MSKLSERHATKFTYLFNTLVQLPQMSNTIINAITWQDELKDIERVIKSHFKETLSNLDLLAERLDQADVQYGDEVAIILKHSMKMNKVK